MAQEDVRDVSRVSLNGGADWVYDTRREGDDHLVLFPARTHVVPPPQGNRIAHWPASVDTTVFP